MKILITGICGFVGSVLARELASHLGGLDIIGVDNLSRPGSEQNRLDLRERKIQVLHGDIRNASDLEGLPRVDWVIDAAANPSVLAGVSGATSSRQLMEHNLLGTVNLLELCKRNNSGFVLLSTSRIYSLPKLSALPVSEKDGALWPRFAEVSEPGFTEQGISEAFSTQPPLSLYGCAKLASELVSLEYAGAFGLPVHVNRCGVLAGGGQFGKPDQGIFSYWIHSYRARRPLKYIGFGGSQVRDCLHPRDLASLITKQLQHPERAGKTLNVSGGVANSISLCQLSRWCARRFGEHLVSSEPTPRQFDVPWLVLDSSSARKEWNWQPETSLEAILEEIARHAEENPGWLEISAGA